MAAFRSSRGIGWVGGCLIAVLLIIIAVVGLGYLGVRQLHEYASSEITDGLDGNPVIAKHIGEIEHVAFEMERSDQMLTGADWDDGWTIWSIRGKRGEGLIRAQFGEREGDESGDSVLIDGILIMEEKEYPLFPEGVPPKKKVEGSGEPKETDPSTKPHIEKKGGPAVEDPK